MIHKISTHRLKFAIVQKFFDYQHLSINVLDFLHRDSYQGNITSKSTNVGWVWSGVLSHAQTWLNLLRGDFRWSGSGNNIKNSLE